MRGEKREKKGKNEDKVTKGEKRKKEKYIYLLRPDDLNGNRMIDDSVLLLSAPVL